MISKQMRRFDIDGQTYCFNPQAFKVYVVSYKKRNEIRGNNHVFKKIAYSVDVTEEAVKNWFYEYNGPSDLEMVIKIAEALNISDYMYLLKEVRECEKMTFLNILQMESAKKIYDMVIEFLDEFAKTDGFTGVLWLEFKDQGSADPEKDLYAYVDEKIAAIDLIIKKEYFYLHNTEIYAELVAFVENKLWDMVDGKLGYAYRFEAFSNGNPTTADDYNKALSRLNDIIEKYATKV